MIDIQSVAAEIRRGKKDRLKPQGKNTMVSPITQGDHNSSVYAPWYSGDVSYDKPWFFFWFLRLSMWL